MYRPSLQDLRCLQTQLFSSLIVTELIQIFWFPVKRLNINKTRDTECGPTRIHFNVTVLFKFIIPKVARFSCQLK